MKFNVQKKGENITSLGRRIGYIPQKSFGWDEVAFIRPIQRDFPRFHLYVKESSDSFIFNLHLDQKKPSYGEHTAHSGEYDGELVENEMGRIMSFLGKPQVQDSKVVPQNKKTGGIADLFKDLFRKN